MQPLSGQLRPGGLAKTLGHQELDWITDADSIMARILADSGLGRLLN